MWCTIRYDPEPESNGGIPSLVWGNLLCWCGALMVALRIAEMASVVPTVGVSDSFGKADLAYTVGCLSPRYLASSDPTQGFLRLDHRFDQFLWMVIQQ